MYHAALAWLLALACASAAADWTPIGGDGTVFAAYADPASVKPSGDGVQMLGLYDFLMADVSADGQPHESTVVLREYDCRDRRVRLLAYVDYAGHMGAGRVISLAGGHGSGMWETIVAGALDEFFLRVACAGGR